MSFPGSSLSSLNVSTVNLPQKHSDGWLWDKPVELSLYGCVSEFPPDTAAPGRNPSARRPPHPEGRTCRFVHRVTRQSGETQVTRSRRSPVNTESLCCWRKQVRWLWSTAHRLQRQLSDYNLQKHRARTTRNVNHVPDESCHNIINETVKASQGRKKEEKSTLIFLKCTVQQTQTQYSNFEILAGNRLLKGEVFISARLWGKKIN